MKRLCLAVLVASLAACGGPKAPEPAFRPITTPGQYIEFVAGRPITFENGGVLITNPDGSITGDFNGVEPKGRWTFEGGQLCRVVTIGPETYPEVCQSLEVGSDSVRFFRPDGTLATEASLG